MATDLIPVVDLRLLSQAEINTLSLSSPNAFDLHRCDDVVVPKIDRSVFNESAGSRKQTYSRLRLAPRKPDAPSSSNSSPSPSHSVARRRSRTLTSTTAPDADDAAGRLENQKIVHYLRQLFAREDPSTFTPSPAKSQALTLTLTLDLDTPPVADGAEEPSRELVLVDDRDRVVLNVKGAAVDLAELGKKNELFGGELRRRTEGLRTEAELLGFLSGLDGQWGSRRKKRKIVDAEGFGDDLPSGWKLLLGLKRKEGIPRLHCRRYISPSGKQFVSCQEVASYLLTLVGHQDTIDPISQNESRAHKEFALGCVVGSVHQADTTQHNPSLPSVAPISSSSVDHDKQDVFRVEKELVEKTLECHKCNITFGDRDALVKHLLSFHQSVKRRRLGKSIGDGVIIKDGKYECQFCHKTFMERHRYNGHIGAHVRYQGLSAEKMPDGTGKIINPTPLSAVPFSGTNELHIKNEDTFTDKSVDKVHDSSLNCRVEIEKHEIEQCANSIETSEVAWVGKSDGGLINNCDIIRDNSKENAEPCNTTSMKFDSCLDGIPPSFTDVHNASEDRSHNVSVSEAGSMRKLVDAEPCNTTSMELDSFVDGISPSLTDVHNASDRSHNISISEAGSMRELIDDQINVFDMNGCKSMDGVEHCSVKDMNASPSPPTTVDNAICSDVNGSDLCSTIESIDAMDGCDNKSGEMASISNASCMKPKSGLHGLTSFPTNSMTHSVEHKVNSGNNLPIVSGSESSYGVPTYSDDASRTKKEHEHMKNELRSHIGSGHALSDKDTVMGDSMHDDFHRNCITPFGNSNIGGISADEGSTFHGVFNGAVLEEEEHNPHKLDTVSIELKSDRESFGALSDKDTSMGNTMHCELRPSSITPLGSDHIFSVTGNADSMYLEGMKVSVLEEEVHQRAEVDRANNELKSNLGSSHALSDQNMVMGNTMQDELHTSYIIPFGSPHISLMERNADSTIHDGMEVSVFEDMKKPCNEMKKYFHICDAEDDAHNVVENDGKTLLDVDMVTSSWLQSSSSLPIMDIITDQSEDGLGGIGEELRIDGGEPFEFVLLAGQGTQDDHASESGYVAQFEGEHHPSSEQEWNMSSPKMAGGCEFAAVCMWCGCELNHEGISDGQESGMVGFMCSVCKMKILG